MRSATLLVGGILPYIAVVVFLVGAASRILAWRRAPQPGLMTLYPTKGSGWGPLAEEAMFFPSLFRGDKSMWVLSWSFHATLACAFAGHLRVGTGLLDRGMVAMGLGRGSVDMLSAIAGGAVGIVLMVAVALLLARRMVLARVREISSPPDFLALLLLVAVISTGNLMRFAGAHCDLAETRVWAQSLLTFSPVVPANPVFLLHVFLAELTILTIAFSKLMHFGGFFFTVSLIKRSQP